MAPSRDAYYCGDIYNGVCNGYGVMYRADGGAFCGKFLYGKPNKGTYAFPNGDFFDGLWQCDKIKNGTYRYKNGDVYKGNFDECGRFCGNGTYTWKNGEKYDGSWYQGYRNGYGTMYYKNGSSKYCYWNKNQPTDW